MAAILNLQINLQPKASANQLPSPRPPGRLVVEILNTIKKAVQSQGNRTMPL